jgi:hypothetical protein
MLRIYKESFSLNCLSVLATLQVSTVRKYESFYPYNGKGCFCQTDCQKLLQNYRFIAITENFGTC